jgi:hypothetical protein
MHKISEPNAPHAAAPKAHPTDAMKKIGSGSPEGESCRNLRAAGRKPDATGRKGQPGGWIAPAGKGRGEGLAARGNNGRRASFGSLAIDRKRPGNARRPTDTRWPILRKPFHGTLEYCSGQVSTFGNLIKFGAAVENNR